MNAPKYSWFIVLMPDIMNLFVFFDASILFVCFHASILYKDTNQLLAKGILFVLDTVMFPKII